MLSRGRRTFFGAAPNSIYISLVSIWTALLLSGVLIVIYPVPGTTIWITLASILSSSLMAPLLGPVGGAVSGLIFGLGAPFINPATSIGPLTFLAPMLGALMSGLVLFDRWKEATIILILQIAIWFAHPFAWYQLMPIVSWEYWLAFAFIIIPPVRKWIIDSIVSRDPKRMPVALWCLAWISRIGGDVITGNNIFIWIFNFTFDFYAYWAPMTLYYAISDSLNCLAGAIVGSALLLALKRSGTRILAVDYFEDLRRKK